MEAVRKDLQTRQIQMIAETEKFVSCERRAYTAERQLAVIQSNNVRLQLDIDKLRMKYEPGILHCFSVTLAYVIQMTDFVNDI